MYDREIVRRVAQRHYQVVFKSLAEHGTYEAFRKDIAAAEADLRRELGADVVTDELLNDVALAVNAAQERLDRQKPKGNVPWSEFERFMWEELDRVVAQRRKQH